MSIDDVRDVATGAIYTGDEAAENGLIDFIGSDPEVEQYLLDVLEVESVAFYYYQQDPTFFDLFASGMSSFGYNIGAGLGASLGQDGVTIKT